MARHIELTPGKYASIWPTQAEHAVPRAHKWEWHVDGSTLILTRNDETQTYIIREYVLPDMVRATRIA
jgi:hypothetical protein